MCLFSSVPRPFGQTRLGPETLALSCLVGRFLRAVPKLRPLAAGAAPAGAMLPMADAMADRLAGFAASSGTTLMIMASRRTPEGLVDRLCAKLPASGVVVPHKDEPNIYPGILGLAEIILVTSDSVNMTSEACITGKPVLSVHLQEEAGRLAHFHEMMQERGHIIRLDEVLSEKKSLPKKMVVLDERAKIAAQIHTFFGIDPE